MKIIAQIVKDVIRSHYEYMNECEKKATDQERAISNVIAKTKELQKNNALAERYFQHALNERERLFDSASKILDVAIKNGDIEIAQIAIKTLEIVHAKSPFGY